MAIVTRHGNESGDTPAPILALTGFEPTTVTSPVNSGTNAWSINTTANASFCEWTYTPPPLDRTHYLRAYVRFGGAPSGLSRFFDIYGPFPGSVHAASVRLTTSRTMQLLDAAGIPVGSVSAVLDINAWHLVEMGLMIPTSGNGQIGMRVNGTEVVAMTSAAINNVSFDRIRVGKDSSVTITNMYIDDYALNDNTTGSNNSWVGGLGGGTITGAGVASSVSSATATAGSLVTVSWNTPPTPANASTISGSVQIEVLTSDNTKVKQVDFLWNDVLIQAVGATQLIPPYDPFFDTTTVADGTGTLKAVVTQTDNQTTQVTRTFTIDNQPGTANDVKVKIPDPIGTLLFTTKPILVKIGGSFVSKPIRVIGAQLPPTAPFIVNWNSPASGATITGQTSLAVSPSDSNRVVSVLYERDSDGLDLGTSTTPPWSLSFNSTVLTNGPVTLRATVTYDTNLTTIVKRDFNIDNSVAPIPSTTVNRAVPGVMWWTTNQTLTNFTGVGGDGITRGGSRGSTTQKNFVEGSVGHVAAYITVWDETVSVEDVWIAMKLYGTSWWLKQPAPTVKYGSGTGGIMNVRMVEVTSTGLPRFTDSSAIVAEELNIDPQTRYNQVRALYPSLAGFTFPSGSDGPMMHYYKLRKNGQPPIVQRGTPYAICIWNSHSFPGTNYFSINPCSVREYIWPPHTPGLANWPSVLKSGGSGRARSPHTFNNMDATMPGAICGLDPRERMMGSLDGGATWPGVGRDTRLDYQGDYEPGNNGMRVPQVPYRRVGQTNLVTKHQLVAGTFDYSVGSNTMDPVPYAVTFTQAWAYTISGAAGTITVVQKRGSSTIATATAQMTNTTTGIQIANLSQNLSLASGDYYTISSSGSGVAWFWVDTNSRLLDPDTATKHWHMGCLPVAYPNGAGKIIS